MKKTNLAIFWQTCFLVMVGVSCTAYKADAPDSILDSTAKDQPIPVVVDKPKEDLHLDLGAMEPKISKDPCKSANAQEAWLALEADKPALGLQVSSEIYYSGEGTSMIAVSQQKREVYGQSGKSYVEVSAETAERGSRVGTFSQVIATQIAFAEAAELFAALPPFWQEKIKDPQAVLVMKHHLLAKNAPGYVKFENEIVAELSTKLEQGVELRCRSAEPCRCY